MQMFDQLYPNTLAFVWQPHDCLDAIAAMAKATETGAIIDFSRQDGIDCLAERADYADFEAKMSIEQVMHSSMFQALRRKKIHQFWIECFPEIDEVDPKIVIKTLCQYPSCDIQLVTGDIALIDELFKQCPKNIHLALKGTEAAGFSGTESLLCLFSYVEQKIASCPTPPKISVWGGVSTPQGAAALLKSGAHRLVFEYAHILTDLSSSFEDPLQSRTLEKFRIDHTVLLPVAENTHFRAYNKGNLQISSLISKEQKNSDAPITDSKTISSRLSKIVGALCDSDPGQYKLIPAGPEAASAFWFKQFYGHKSRDAIEAFSHQVSQEMLRADQQAKSFIYSPLKKNFGYAYPFLQGAMACITDRPEFALAVAKAGALPTFAMGGRNPKAIEQELKKLSHLLSGFRYAVNIITLPENPFLSEQVEWIKKARPPFVVISAGPPSAAKQFQAHGIEVIYVTCDPDLLRLAWETGISYVVLEGHEAGGHIGSHSTLTIAQAALTLQQQNPLFAEKPLMLAGGFFNASTIYRAAVLGAKAVQLGTAYLATKEIIELGGLAQQYQDMVVNAGFGDTAVTGQAMGLSVRSLKSPLIEKIKELEQKLGDSGGDEAIMRHELEKNSMGSLFIAARSQLPGQTEHLPKDVCHARGQYMCGSGAGGISKVLSVSQLHEQLADINGGIGLSAPKPVKRAEKPDEKPMITVPGNTIPGNTESKRIAITGMAVSNALGNSPSSVWQACIEGQCGITKIPQDRWDYRQFYSAQPGTKGKTYCNFGAFSSLDISRKELGISPHDFRTMANSTRLTLWLADKAVKDCGLIDRGISKDRIGVIIAQNSGESSHTIGDLTITVNANELAVKIARDLGLEAVAVNEIVDSLNAGRISIDDTTLLGRLNSAAGGFICNKFNFRGISFAVTAACATGLVALFNAVHLIRSGVIDAALVGGGEEKLHPASFIEFSALGALAGQSQKSVDPKTTSRPFDAGRDGMVLGEGGAMIIIEREDIAQQTNADIYAYIAGVGCSNNDTGLVESDAASQEQAMIASLKDASYDPAQVDYVECHATATQTGDLEEIKALKAVYPQNSGTVLGSFKSQIGHTLGASGLNSLIRGVCAMRAKVFPKVFNYDTPDPLLSPESWGFRLPREPEIWPYNELRPRRFQVNAFGFGGSNYVVQLEQADWLPDHPDNPAFLPLINNAVSAKPLGMIFSGQGTYYSQMGKELYHTFPLIRHWMDKIAGLADFDILHMLFNETELNLQRTEWQQPALFILEYAVYMQLAAYGIRPSVLAGHSMGELTALCAANVFTYKDAYNIISKRALCMEKAGSLVDDPGKMLAVDAPKQILRQIVEADPNLYFTNYNSPHQTVIGGSSNAVAQLQETLKAKQYWHHMLPVPMAFHSPVMKVIQSELGDYLAGIEFHPPQIPVISNTTKEPYPDEPEAIRQIILAHLESPVYWQDNILRMHREFDVDMFVEVGPRDTLCRLLSDIVPESRGIATCFPGQEAGTLRSAVAALSSHGHITPPVEPENMVLFTDAKARPHDEQQIRTIIQQQINDFALNGVQKYLKPAIVRTIRQTVDPEFSKHDLDTYLGAGLPTSQFAASRMDRTVFDKDSPMQPKPETGYENQGSTLERLITIIMDATGYERDEIQPDMDIRNDLAIRSIRLPVIIDAVERLFSITIVLEDFMGVRTVAEFAEKIDAVKSGKLKSRDTEPDEKKNTATQDGHDAGLPALPLINRMVFHRKKLLPPKGDRIEIPNQANILLLQFEEVREAGEVTAYLSKTYQSHVIPLMLTGPKDLKAPNTLKQELEELTGRQEIAGVILLTGEKLEFASKSERIRQICTMLLYPIQALLKSDARLFCLHLQMGRTKDRFCSLAAQGMLGIMLSAQIEYAHTIFRSLWVKDRPNMNEIFDWALDRHLPLIELELSQGTLYTQELVAQPWSCNPGKSLCIRSTDVIVASGGAGGVTMGLLEALAKFGCTFVLLGRSECISNIDPTTIPCEEDDLPDYAMTLWPSLAREERPEKLNRLRKTRDIHQAVEALQKKGATAVYKQCDVTQANEVEKTLSDIMETYGKIDGIIHGAGILRDRFIHQQSFEDFQAVVDTKFLGLKNLLTHTAGSGLCFALAFSSIAAITGNVGQANYCCANRMMTAYLDHLGETCNVTVKSIFLPPIEGAGMANDPEIRELITLKIGEDAFADAYQTGELITRELLLSPSETTMVAFARKLPKIKSAAMKEISAGQDIQHHDLSSRPMIDEITGIDFKRKQLTAQRILTHGKDLWIQDHKPMTWLEHPIMSGIMVVETMLETATLLYPYLHPVGLYDVKFERILECPENADTQMDIICRDEPNTDKPACCKVLIGGLSKGQDPRLHHYFSGSVILDQQSDVQAGPEEMIEEKFLSRIQHPIEVLSQPDLQVSYAKNTGLTGRYRVLDTIGAWDKTTIQATMIYPDINDFNETATPRVCFPVYILEALMQLPNFHSGLNQPDEPLIYLPIGFLQLKFSGICNPGDRIHLYAERQPSDAGGVVWSGKGVSNKGALILELTSLFLKKIE